MTAPVPLSEVTELVERALDPAAIERGKRRQAAIWLHEEPDYLPLLLGHTERFLPGFAEDRTWKMAEHELQGGVRCAEIFDYPHYTFRQQREDPAKMLYEMLWEILSWARSRSDAVLSVRPYFLRSVESALGMDVEITEESHAHVRKYLPPEQVYNLDTKGLLKRGVFPRIERCIDFMKDHLPEHVHIFPGDTGGPLGLAEALRGNELWYDFYDRPEHVDALLGKCEQLCISLAYWYKERIGDPREQSYHGSLFQARGGVRGCDDPIVNLSPEKYLEHVMPHLAAIFREFDGGWFHSCGFFPHHLDLLLACPEITAINFGNPELWPDFEATLKKIIDAGKIYYGALPVHPGETVEDAFRRALRATGGKKRGLIPFLQLQGAGPWPEPQEIMDTWHRVQDEMCSPTRS
ncbi:MAG: hypothetical protein V2A58_13275 [Planctomycetota bacterium]